jgi:hypothetical protein
MLTVPDSRRKFQTALKEVHLWRSLGVVLVVLVRSEAHSGGTERKVDRGRRKGYGEVEKRQ